MDEYDQWQGQGWERALDEETRTWLRHDPVARRVRWVYFPSSGNEVLIVDNAVMYQIRRGEIKSRKRRDGYSHPDSLAEEILTDVPEWERTTSLLLERARKNVRYHT